MTETVKINESHRIKNGYHSRYGNIEYVEVELLINHAAKTFTVYTKDEDGDYGVFGGKTEIDARKVAAMGAAITAAAEMASNILYKNKK